MHGMSGDGRFQQRKQHMQRPWAGVSLGCSGNYKWGKNRREPGPEDLLSEMEAPGGLEQREMEPGWHLEWRKKRGYSPTLPWDSFTNVLASALPRLPRGPFPCSQDTALTTPPWKGL